MAVRSPPASGYNRDHVFALRVTATHCRAGCLFPACHMKLNIKTSIQYEDQLPGAEFPRNMALMHVRNVGIRLGRSLASCIANRGGAMTGVKRYAPAGVPIRLFSQPQLSWRDRAEGWAW